MNSIDMTQWSSGNSAAAIRFAAASAWQTWARPVLPDEAQRVAGMIRGEAVRGLAASSPANEGYPEAFVDAFSEVCERWTRLKRSEQFTEETPLLTWRGAPLPMESSTAAWSEQVLNKFGAATGVKFTGVSFEPGFAEGCAAKSDGADGWHICLDPNAAGHDTWLGLRIGADLQMHPCQSWMGALPALLSALAKQAWEFQLFMGLPPSARRKILEQLTPSSPLTELYARCEESSWWEALALLCEISVRPGAGPAADSVAADLAAWRKEGIVPEEAVLGLVLYCQYGLKDALDEYTQRKWIYHPQQVIATLEGRLEDVVPVTVDVVPTLECPQDCCGCSNADWRKTKEEPGWLNKSREERMMSEPVMKAMLERIAAAGTKAVVFTGGGEPMMNRNTVIGAQHARKLGLEVGLYTDGIVMNNIAIDALIDCQVTFVRYSINAGSPAAHARVGGYKPNDNKFRRVTEGLRHLAARNRASGHHTTVGVSFIASDLNLDELGKLGRWLRELEDDPETQGGIDYLTIRPILAHRSYRDGEQLGAEIFEEAHRRIEEEVRPALRGTGIKVIEVVSRFTSSQDKERPYKKCTSTPWFGASGPDGSRYLCAESYYGNKLIQLGNMAKNSVSEIFHSDQARDVITNINFKNCPPVCKMHELNKYFELLLRMSETQREWAKNWLLTLGQTTEPPPHVNFI
ncbi:MAG: radical SAM protein [Rudaea sp.]|nr:radical SAM protein [Rudaea sp.]